MSFDANSPDTLTNCPGCGYSFRGLPAAGVCPECGRAYDSSALLVLYGYACGPRATALNCRPSALVLRAVFFILPPLLPSLFGDAPHWLTLTLLLAVSAAFALQVWPRFVRATPTLVQARLNDQGCIQIDELSSWALADLLMVVLFAAGLTFVTPFPLAGFETLIPFGVLGVLTLIILFIILFGRWRAARSPGYGLMAASDRKRFTNVPAAVRWSEIAVWELHKAGGDRYRLCLRTRGDFWHAVKEPVHIEFACDAARAFRLGDSLHRWVRDGVGPGRLPSPRTS